ncbi:ras-related protein Rab-20 [Hydra vulgaris]|uniref:ras-related protein Rab-20 n=1 Tax=Hydra vulgaris TaxID=6087 RepID=UPI001F5F7D9A|nr:ras-related protein Rab-20-like [Hydra vulgaris]
MNNQKQKVDKKVIILGNAKVGKSCLINRYMNETFSENARSTIGCCYFSKQWGKKNIAVWDTGGEERFNALTSFYCRYAHAAILCYCLNDRLSFDAIDTIHVPLLSSASENCLIVLVGTKLDLLNTSTVKNSNLRAVLPEEARSKLLELTQRFKSPEHPQGILPVFETSSKENIQVHELFEFVFNTLVSETELNPDASEETVTLEVSRLNEFKKKCC